MFRKLIEKQKAKRAFEKLVTPERIEQILRDGVGPARYHHGRIEFIVIFIRGESPDDVSERVSRISELARASGAMVDHVISSLVIVTFGTHPTSVPEPGTRLLLVQALQEEFGRDIKIVHGALDGHSGIFGDDEQSSYSFLVPQFDQVLGKLSHLEFGEAAEFTPESA